MVSIYISIASYRDEHLQSTIDSAIATAHYPEQLTFGCFIQLLESDYSSKKYRVTNTYGGRVFYEEVLAGTIFSVSSCRNRANQWLTDHQFVLQVDSHTKFTPGWDLKLVQWLGDLPDNSLLSTYLPGWRTADDGKIILLPDYSTGCQFPVYNNEVAKGYFIRTYDLVPDLSYVSKSSKEAKRNWYLCGHFIFGPANYFKTVRQPEWILFWGEELYHSLLAASYGWRVYSPPERVLRHLYPQDLNGKLPPKLWTDFTAEWSTLHDTSTDAVIDAILHRTTGPGYFLDASLIDEVYGFIGYDIGELLDGWRNERKALH